MHVCIGALPPCEGGLKTGAAPRLTQGPVLNDTGPHTACYMQRPPDQSGDCMSQ